MDLTKLKTSKADEGAVMEVLHPTDDTPIAGMTLTLLGQDSKKNQAIQRRKAQAAIDRMAKGRKAGKLNAEKLEEDSIDDLTQLTVAWSGFELHGEVMEFTPENVRKVYTDYPFIREQASAFIADRANFF